MQKAMITEDRMLWIVQTQFHTLPTRLHSTYNYNYYNYIIIVQQLHSPQAVPSDVSR